MMDHLMAPLEDLVAEELKRAKAEWGERYASLHEGYGVLAEEVMEAEDEMKSVCMRREILLRQIHSESPIRSELSLMRMEALRCAAECIQVAAVCEKMGGM